MSLEEFEKFEGYDRVPSAKERKVWSTIFSYVQYFHEMPPSSWMKIDPALNSYVVQDMRKSGYASKENFKSITKIMAQKLFYVEDGALRTSLDVEDDFVQKILLAQFPEFGGEFRLLDEEKSLFASVSHPSESKIQDIESHFRPGAYIYRYARNLDVKKATDVRVACGHLSIIDRVKSERFPRFRVQYRWRHPIDKGTFLGDEILGRVYPISDFFFFVGCENRNDNPFMMVTRNNLNMEEQGGLVLRRYEQNGDYFASRVIVAIDNSAQGGGIDIGPKTAKSSGLTRNELKVISNLVRMNGKSVLTMPEF